jgi:hypothetical protein|tara:strand:- start:332 stop:715 length:384 start_codon:yes stop_codon:yes gene_type:complete
MKRFKETNKELYEISRKDKLALDMALISEAGNDMCSVPLEKLRSKVMRDRHKKLCMTPKNVNTKSMWSKAAQKAAGGRHKLYNSLEEGPENIIILIQDITKQMITALQKGDERKLKGLYKNLGKVIK